MLLYILALAELYGMEGSGMLPPGSSMGKDSI